MKQQLEVLYERMFGPGKYTFENLEILAERLSFLSGRTRPWTAKFLDSILYEYKGYKEYKSDSLSMAIQLLLSSLDGQVQAMVVSDSAIISTTPLPPGTVIQGNLLKCTCGLHFVPKWGSQKYHSKACKRAHERRKYGKAS